MRKPSARPFRPALLAAASAALVLASVAGGCKSGKSKLPPLEVNLLLTPVSTKSQYITPDDFQTAHARVALVDFRTPSKKPAFAEVCVGTLQTKDRVFRPETETWTCESSAEIADKLDPFVENVPVGFIMMENGLPAGARAEPGPEFLAFLKDLRDALVARDIIYTYVVAPDIITLR